MTNGAEFLLDTNYILGLLKSNPDVLADVSARGIHLSQSCYSAITRMELLGFPSSSASLEKLNCPMRSSPLLHWFTTSSF